jgi:hypothetical protein
VRQGASVAIGLRSLARQGAAARECESETPATAPLSHETGELKRGMALSRFDPSVIALEMAWFTVEPHAFAFEPGAPSTKTG